VQRRDTIGFFRRRTALQGALIQTEPIQRDVRWTIQPLARRYCGCSSVANTTERV